MPCPCSELTRMVSQPRSFAKAPPRRQMDVMPVGKDHHWIGMDFAVLQPRHAMIHAAGDFADFRMQRAAEGDVHFLQAAADAEDRHAARDAGFRQRQRDVVAMDVVGLVPLMRLGLEAGRMNIGAGAGQHDAVDHVEQGAESVISGEPANISGNAPDTSATARRLRSPTICVCETIFDAMGVSDHTDHGPSHRENLLSSSCARIF